MERIVYREARLDEYKGETCLVAERDGEIIAVGLLQQKDFSMVSYLLNGIFKLFRYISPWKLMK